ncbi:MAG: hypothetical protein L0338_38970 [Acidobacteria bacterium]|nr:hypothetical protein [Acidobacteriota bacterium]
MPRLDSIFHLTDVVYDIIMYDMILIQVLSHPTRPYKAYIDPAGSFPVQCIARWEDGRKKEIRMAKIDLFTWDFSGDQPPNDLLQWLSSNQGWLMEAWQCWHPHETLQEDGGSKPI